MRTIETVATIAPDGTLTAQMPSGVVPGQHRIVVVLDQESGQPAARTPKPPVELHVSPWEGWPADCTFRRKDLYGDEGR